MLTACAPFNSFLIPFLFFPMGFSAFLVNIFSLESLSFYHYLNNYNSVCVFAFLISHHLSSWTFSHLNNNFLSESYPRSRSCTEPNSVLGHRQLVSRAEHCKMIMCLPCNKRRNVFLVYVHCSESNRQECFSLSLQMLFA